jgi:hypothetical protein
MMTARLMLHMAAAASLAGSAGDPPRQPIVPYPHPLITEILYAVPGGDPGDANGDGVRDAVGDEFVELVNPHDRPIQLRGYTITDRQQISPRDGRPYTSVRFTFPALELKPGEVAVVFNGHNQNWTGPVGDSSRAAAGNGRFGSARVFTMKNTSPKSGFANGGDCVILWSPDDEPVHAIRWGGAAAPPQTAVVEEAPAVTNVSVARPAVDAPLSPHPPRTDGRRFSPGLFPNDRAR